MSIPSPRNAFNAARSDTGRPSRKNPTHVLLSRDSGSPLLRSRKDSTYSFISPVFLSLGIRLTSVSTASMVSNSSIRLF